MNHVVYTESMSSVTPAMLKVTKEMMGVVFCQLTIAVM